MKDFKAEHQFYIRIWRDPDTTLQLGSWRGVVTHMGSTTQHLFASLLALDTFIQQHIDPPPKNLPEEASPILITPNQIECLRQSLAHLRDKRDLFVAAFYGELFRQSPALRNLFPDQTSTQAEKLFLGFTLSVDALDDPIQFRNLLGALGQRHVRYGVQPHHYQLAGQALNKALQICLANAYDEATQAAWHSLFTLVTEAMRTVQIRQPKPPANSRPQIPLV